MEKKKKKSLVRIVRRVSVIFRAKTSKIINTNGTKRAKEWRANWRVE